METVRIREREVQHKVRTMVCTLTKYQPRIKVEVNYMTPDDSPADKTERWQVFDAIHDLIALGSSDHLLDLPKFNRIRVVDVNCYAKVRVEVVVD